MLPAVQRLFERARFTCTITAASLLGAAPQPSIRYSFARRDWAAASSGQGRPGAFSDTVMLSACGEGASSRPRGEAAAKQQYHHMALERTSSRCHTCRLAPTRSKRHRGAALAQHNYSRRPAGGLGAQIGIIKSASCTRVACAERMRARCPKDDPSPKQQKRSSARVLVRERGRGARSDRARLAARKKVTQLMNPPS